MNTPTYWAEYLAHLETLYKAELNEWHTEHQKIIEENATRSFLQKIWHTNAQRLQEHSWQKPWSGSRRFEPTILGYYKWDVKIRQKNAAQ